MAEAAPVSEILREKNATHLRYVNELATYGTHSQFVTFFQNEEIDGDGRLQYKVEPRSSARFKEPMTADEDDEALFS